MRRLLALLISLLAACPQAALSQYYPRGPIGMIVVQTSTPEEFVKPVSAEIEAMGRAVKAANLKIE